jgi:hypothetical protein
VRKYLTSTSIAAALVLACGACGSSGNSSQSKPASDPGSTSSSPTGSPFPTSAAKAAASAALLTISDLPQGWSTSKQDDSDDSDTDKFATELSDCLHAPPGVLGDKDTADSVHEDSPDFDSPDGDTTISETVSVSRSSHADQVFALLRQPNATDCLTTAMTEVVKQMIADSKDADLHKATIGDVQVGQLNAGHYGDDTVALRITVPLEVSGLSVSVYDDEVYIRHSNAVANLSFEGTGTPVDTEIASKFAKLATQKLVQGTYPAG